MTPAKDSPNDDHHGQVLLKYKVPQMIHKFFHDSGNYFRSFFDYIVGHMKKYILPSENVSYSVYGTTSLLRKRIIDRTTSPLPPPNKEDRIECKIRYSKLDSTHLDKLSFGHFAIDHKIL